MLILSQDISVFSWCHILLISVSVAIIFGLWNCFGILLGDVRCLLSGMWQMVAGFLVIVCEAPCCCMFVDSVQQVSEFVERKPHWQKAVGYMS